MLCVVDAQLDHTLTGTDAQRELATHLRNGKQGIQAIYDLFGPSEPIIPSQPIRPVTPQTPTPYLEGMMNARLVQSIASIVRSDLDDCVVCGRRDSHSAAHCPEMVGLCFTCGNKGHSSKHCPLKREEPATPSGFCCRCKLPVYVVAGVKVHDDKFGWECGNTVLAECAKSILMCGKVRGVKIASAPSTYFERLRWASEGSPPNIIALVARIAKPQSSGKRHRQETVPISPEIEERIRANRLAALQRLNRSDDSLVSPSPSQPETPQTQLVQRVPSGFLQVTPPTIEQVSAQKLFGTIGIRLPTVSFPADCCVRCAGAMHAGACSDLPVNQVLYNAGCCACCALPVRCVLVIALFVCRVFV